SWFLLTRGVWLLFVEVAVLHLLIWFNLNFSFIGPLQVIWAIGWSMIALAALVHLPLRAIAVIGVGMIALHNTLDGVMNQSLLWVEYPLVPWIGVMAAGYAFGALYELDADRRVRIVARLGVAMLAAFIIIRATNIYGDPSHWSVQRTALFTLFSFINTTKYPPSLLYLLMTLGPALLALAVFEAGGAGEAGKA